MNTWFEKGQVVQLDNLMPSRHSRAEWAVVEEDLGAVMRVWTFGWDGQKTSPIRKIISTTTYEVTEQPGIKGLAGLAVWLVRTFGDKSVPVDYFKNDQHTLAEIYVYGKPDDSERAFVLLVDEMELEWALCALEQRTGRQDSTNREKRMEAFRKRMAIC